MFRWFSRDRGRLTNLHLDYRALLTIVVGLSIYTQAIAYCFRFMVKKRYYLVVDFEARGRPDAGHWLSREGGFMRGLSTGNIYGFSDHRIP